MEGVIVALRKVLTAFALATLLWSLSGCVSPGPIDDTMVARYQKVMLDRSPQPRAGGQNLDLLRPLPEAPELALKVVPDDLTKRQVVEINLDDTIRLSLRSNLDIRSVGFDVAVSREQVIQAAANFDYVVFGSVQKSVQDQQIPIQNLNNLGGGNVKTFSAEAGIKQNSILGGQWDVKWDVTRTFTNNTITTPNPAWQSITAFEMAQPLLRGAGPDYALAQLHLAQLGNKASYAQFRQKVEEVVQQTETAYWNLVQARGTLFILQGLLDETIQTLDKVEKRTELDAARNLEYKQSYSAMKSREALVIRARKTVGDAEDALATLLSDPQLNIMHEYGIKPATAEPAIENLQIDRADQLLTAMRNNPTLEQARLAIQASDIQVMVAKNELLPQLDFKGSIGPNGLARTMGGALDHQWSFDFISWSAGLLFQYPLGNRLAEAKLAQTKYERCKNINDLQNNADQLAQAINESIRQIETTQQESVAQQQAADAETDHLGALDAAMEVGRQSYLVLLQLKLQAQENRANARVAVLTADVNERIAIARLAQFVGTNLQQHNIKLSVESVIDLCPKAAPEANNKGLCKPKS